MFCTVEDVRNALAPGGSPSDKSSAASLEESDIVGAIEEADAQILALIGTRYTIPTEPVANAEGNIIGDVAEAPVRWWSRNLAAYLALLTWRRNQEVPENHPVRLRYAQTVALLERVGKGEAFPGLPEAGDDATPGNQVFVHNLNPHSVFGPDDYGMPSGYGSPAEFGESQVLYSDLSRRSNRWR